ncbi:AraC family transcriptional regulator [Comamonadaceae bacterium G21597-S1]|nr:AraC family transcriptional regulator [Comamonadaceae bacterium G21597-S1]
MIDTMTADNDQASGSPAAASGFDVLSDVLRCIRLTGSMLFLVDAHTPWMSWAPRAQDFQPVVLPCAQHLVSFHVVTQGSCWAGLDGVPPERFETGDVLVVPHGDGYHLASPRSAQPSYGHDEALAFFRTMAAGELPTVIHEGGRGAETTQFICGFLGCDTQPCNPLLDALPSMAHLRTSAGPSDRLRHLIDFALCELRQPSSGGRIVLLRLAELMFVEVIRRYLETMADGQTGWLAGLHDPLVARALARLHHAPDRRWTLDELATQVGTSRTVLAARFAQIVGQPPMQYLTQWRMQLATRLLAHPTRQKVATVADAVGYGSEAAFSRAFKKCTGLSPAAWRLRDGA